MRKCFFSHDFISGQRLHNILPEIHFCQNDRNEVTPVMNFISDWPDTELHFISPEMKSHVNTL